MHASLVHLEQLPQMYSYCKNKSSSGNEADICNCSGTSIEVSLCNHDMKSKIFWWVHFRGVHKWFCKAKQDNPVC